MREELGIGYGEKNEVFPNAYFLKVILNVANKLGSGKHDS
jgi:hypothetical protein